MTKYYRVKKDTFMWKEDAILFVDNDNHCHAIEDIWNNVDIKNEYISAHIIEHPDNGDWFERVYKDNIVGHIYKTKDQLIEQYKKSFI